MIVDSNLLVPKLKMLPHSQMPVIEKPCTCAQGIWNSAVHTVIPNNSKNVYP